MGFGRTFDNLWMNGGGGKLGRLFDCVIRACKFFFYTATPVTDGSFVCLITILTSYFVYNFDFYIVDRLIIHTNFLNEKLL